MSIKIVALFAPAGAGKDYVLNYICENYVVNKIVSHSSRPPRQGEVNGEAYHFISEDCFATKIQQGDFLEYTSFRNWYYGTSRSALSRDIINVGVFNISGIKELLKDRHVEVYPVYINALDKTRLLRQLEREDFPDCGEICRRFETDKEDFKRINFNFKSLNNDDSSTKQLSSDVDELWSKLFNFKIEKRI